MNQLESRVIPGSRSGHMHKYLQTFMLYWLILVLLGIDLVSSYNCCVQEILLFESVIQQQILSTEDYG